MPSVPTGSRLAVALEVRAAAEAVDSGALPGDRARGVLDALTALLPCCAAAVERWDPVGGTHETLASSGYAGEVLAAIETGFHADPHFPAVRGPGGPLRMSDIPEAGRRGPMFERVIGPSRYTDGVSVCLTAGERYVGALHASTAGPAVDDEAVALLRLLGPDLTALVDPLGGVPLPVPDGEGGMLAWRPGDGSTVALTPGAEPALVAPPGPLRELLHPARWPSRLGCSLLVLRGSALTAVEASPAGAWVVVAHRPAPAPGGLSLRELEVLAALAGGATDRMVARALGVSERTVGSHVGHLLTKLGAGNRAAAAATAVRLGLVHLPVRTAPGAC
ncbi:LuxR C-terminal-related transcriptional regulator [Blastococcus sp. SYSU D00820]